MSPESGIRVLRGGGNAPSIPALFFPVACNELFDCSGVSKLNCLTVLQVSPKAVGGTSKFDFFTWGAIKIKFENRCPRVSYGPMASLNPSIIIVNNRIRAFVV